MLYEECQVVVCEGAVQLFSRDIQAAYTFVSRKTVARTNSFVNMILVDETNIVLLEEKHMILLTLIGVRMIRNLIKLDSNYFWINITSKQPKHKQTIGGKIV